MTGFFDHPEAAAWAAERVDTAIAAIVREVSWGLQRRRIMRPIRQVERALYHYHRARFMIREGRKRGPAWHYHRAQILEARARAAVSFVLDGRTIDPSELLEQGLAELGRICP